MSRKSSRFIADSVRVTPSRFIDGVYVEARECRSAPPAVAYVPAKSIPALIEALSAAALAAGKAKKARG